MTALTPTPPPEGIDDLINRLQGRAAEIVKHSDWATSEALRALPPEIRFTEVPWVARTNMVAIFRALRANATPSDDDLRPARAIAVQRADEGVPLSVVIRNWQRGFEGFWAEATVVARPDETDQMAYLGTALIALFGTYSATLVDAYEQEKVILDSEKSSAGHLVARMILDGQEARPYADRFRIALAEAYHVLALEISSTPDELIEDATGRLVAGRRKMRKILSLPEFHRTNQTLTTLGPAGGHLLMPVDSDGRSSAQEVAEELVERIRSSVDVPIRAGLVQDVPITDVPSAGRLASGVLRLSAGHHAERVIYRLADVALPYQLTRPSPAGTHIRRVLEPIEPFPELVEFLEHYLRCDMDRARTARTLGVHPNTVNNRLHKVASLSGIDPSGFEGVMAFGAALAVARAESGGVRGADATS